MRIMEGGVCAAKGFTAGGIHCGIRANKTKKDLALIVSECPASAAAVYTTNKVKGAPILVTKKNLEVTNADILDFDFANILQPYVVAGNIPYYITSPIIEKILKAKNKPEKIVLLIQKEVAERIASDKETMLSLFVKNYADTELGPVVGREEFTPPPKVDSQVIILELHGAVVREEVSLEK